MATEPILQVGSLRAKTYCQRRPALGDGQTLQPHAQSQQKQDLALHLGGCPSVRRCGAGRERGQSSRAAEPEAAAGWSSGLARASHPLKGEGGELEAAGFPGGGGGGGGK